MRVVLLTLLFTGCTTYNIDQSVRESVYVTTPVGIVRLPARNCENNPYLNCKRD